MSGRYESIVDTIGRTPVVRIRRLAPAGVNLYVKVEAFNPLGSVKDRLAMGVIEDAERRGELKTWPRPPIPEFSNIMTILGETMFQMLQGSLGIPDALKQAQTKVDQLMRSKGRY